MKLTVVSIVNEGGDCSVYVTKRMKGAKAKLLALRDYLAIDSRNDMTNAQALEFAEDTCNVFVHHTEVV